MEGGVQNLKQSFGTPAIAWTMQQTTAGRSIIPGMCGLNESSQGLRPRWICRMQMGMSVLGHDWQHSGKATTPQVLWGRREKQLLTGLSSAADGVKLAGDGRRCRSSQASMPGSDRRKTSCKSHLTIEWQLPFTSWMMQWQQCWHLSSVECISTPWTHVLLTSSDRPHMAQEAHAISMPWTTVALQIPLTIEWQLPFASWMMTWQPSWLLVWG